MKYPTKVIFANVMNTAVTLTTQVQYTLLGSVKLKKEVANTLIPQQMKANMVILTKLSSMHYTFLHWDRLNIDCKTNKLI